MNAYSKSLFTFGKIYRAVENSMMQAAIALNLGELIGNIRIAKEAAMLQAMELLISNIRACKTAHAYEACEDAFIRTLLMPYPEYTSIYYQTVLDAFNRQDLIIQQSFNQ